MKYRISRFIGTLCCLLAFAFTAEAQQISFVKNCSWEELKARAQKEDKPIFVDVYTSWCAPCKKMAATVFKDPEVVAYMDKNYISIQLDAEKEKSHGFFANFHPGAYPSFYWLDKNGRLLSTKTGYMPSEPFLKSCRDAQTGALGKQIEEYDRRWKAGDREDAFVEKYLFEVLPQVFPDSIRPYFNQYLDGLSPEKLKSRGIGKLLCRFTRTIIDDKVWTTLLEYNDVYSSELEPSLDFDRYMYMNLVRIPMSVWKDKAKFHSYMDLIESKKFPNKELYLNLIQMESNIFEGNYKEALEQALAIGAANESTRPYLYREMAYTFIIGKFFVDSYSPSDAEKKDILTLTQKAFELTPSKSTVSYLAAAYARSGDYKKAYETLAILPFHKEPVLSNAVYSLLNLPRKR